MALARGLIEILPETTTGMQIGRTLMIFQTRNNITKEFKVGQHLQNKNTEGKIAYEKELKEKKDNIIKGKK